MCKKATTIKEPFGERDRNHGFTLIEVLIALTVCSIGLLGLLALQLWSIRGVSAGGAATRANAFAQLHMEKIVHADYDAPGLKDVNAANNGELDSVVNVDHENTGVDGAAAGPEPFRLIINVADHQPVRHAKTVVVLVTWDNGKRKRKLCTIKTIHNQSAGG